MPKSTPTLHRAGGQRLQTAYSSLPTFDPVNVMRVFDNEFRNDAALYKQLLPVCGSAPITIVEQPLTPDLVASGPPTTYVGILDSLDNGTSDSDSEAARMWGLNATITNVF